MSIRVILISSQKVLAIQVLAYEISKFKISFKMYLQEHLLQLKYTKLEYSIMYCCSTTLFYYYLYIIILHFHIPFYFLM